MCTRTQSIFHVPHDRSDNEYREINKATWVERKWRCCCGWLEKNKEETSYLKSEEKRFILKKNARKLPTPEYKKFSPPFLIPSVGPRSNPSRLPSFSVPPQTAKSKNPSLQSFLRNGNTWKTEIRSASYSSRSSNSSQFEICCNKAQNYIDTHRLMSTYTSPIHVITQCSIASHVSYCIVMCRLIIFRCIISCCIGCCNT